MAARGRREGGRSGARSCRVAARGARPLGGSSGALGAAAAVRGKLGEARRRGGEVREAGRGRRGRELGEDGGGGGGAGEVTAAAARGRGRWGSGEMGLVGLGPARPAPLVDLGFRTLAEGGNFSRGLPSAKVFFNFFLFSFSFLLLI